MRIILASKSPRRKEILSSLGIKFDIIVSEADESSSSHDPAELVSILSERKGMAVAEKLKSTANEDTLIISSDTVVALDGAIFGKPSDTEEAESMIRELSGKAHSVFSGISLILISKDKTVKSATDFEKTVVTFKKMTDKDISLYLSLENVLDKAGAYAIQGAASLWIDGIKGNYFNVVGLPVNKIAPLAEKLGLRIEDLISKE
ncbi:MAG: septum formation protein Maf [Ruminococcaceae bacterium]|nr:septum formation protein Maf [Oscillospiraceae bacterium]